MLSFVYHFGIKGFVNDSFAVKKTDFKRKPVFFLPINHKNADIGMFYHKNRYFCTELKKRLQS